MLIEAEMELPTPIWTKKIIAFERELRFWFPFFCSKRLTKPFEGLYDYRITEN